jgi:hypothetical protein
MEPPRIAIHVDGLYIELRGPFPRAIEDAADKMLQFTDRYVVIDWLSHEWPDWRKNIVASKNLLY